MTGSPEQWFEAAAQAARRALCLRSRCGAVLVKDGRILAAGYNGPPQDDLALRSCHSLVPSRHKPKADRSCCLHAEWKALEDALLQCPVDVVGSTMVFCRVDANGQMLKSGNPYCTVCSRLTLHRGVGFWMLWHEGGIQVYSATEYHRLSERYDDFISADTVPDGMPSRGF